MRRLVMREDQDFKELEEAERDGKDGCSGFETFLFWGPIIAGAIIITMVGLLALGFLFFPVVTACIAGVGAFSVLIFGIIQVWKGK